MVDFDIDFEEIWDEKPLWILRMVIYLIMTITGFALYAHFTHEENKYLAMAYVKDLQTFDSISVVKTNASVQNKYINLMREFINNPFTKEVVGEGFYLTLKPLAEEALLDPEKFAEFKTELVKLEIGLTPDVIDLKIEEFKTNRLVWILGASGIFLFLVGLYFGLKV